MDEKILRETFDHNLNESFRLKQLENGLSGSISITPGASGVSGSFSLSSVKNQWSLVCTVSGIPY